METYICLLRAVNVGGANKLLMGRFRELLQEAGLEDIQTYIQSGNAVFRSSKDGKNLGETLEASLEKELGNRVHVLLYTAGDFRRLTSGFGTSEGDYFVFLKHEPEAGKKQMLEGEDFEFETIRFNETIGYLHCRRGMGKAKLHNNLIEKKLGVPATTRNAKTVSRLLEMADDR